MKVAQLLENELPSALDMLQLLVKKGEPVLLVSYTSEDGWIFRQVLDASKEGAFSDHAGIYFGGKRYVSVETYGEGHYSWLKNGTGTGNGSMAVPVPLESSDFDLVKLKVLNDRLPMFVFGTVARIAKLKAKHHAN